MTTVGRTTGPTRTFGRVRILLGLLRAVAGHVGRSAGQRDGVAPGVAAGVGSIARCPPTPEELVLHFFEHPGADRVPA